MILLDTCALLWLASGGGELSEPVLEQIYEKLDKALCFTIMYAQSPEKRIIQKLIRRVILPTGINCAFGNWFFPDSALPEPDSKSSDYDGGQYINESA